MLSSVSSGHLDTVLDLELTYQSERDDKEAIDESNIIDERTRGAKPISTYKEPGDTEGLPEDTGRSAVSTTDQALGSK